MKLGKFYIETYGCQMNEHDSEQMAAQLEELGYASTSDISSADVVLVNTCTIREKPEHKVYSFLGRLRKLKRRNPHMIIGVGGCVAQQHDSALLDRVPHLDFVIGTHQAGHLGELLETVRLKRTRLARTCFDTGVFSRRLLRARVHRAAAAARAYVTVMEGCDNFCSFCVVPYVRGRERSRPSREILQEVRRLTEAGVVEITLLGQNVNSYGRKDGDISFPQLLKRLGEVEGLARLRFTTSHPRDFSAEVIQAFADIPTLCGHVHLPLQSGSTRILRRMNRGYTRAEYLEKVKSLRQTRPGIAVTSDMIVGFPGETEKDFQETLSLMEKVRFDGLYSFQYSARPGTAASRMADDVPPEEKARRLKILQKLQDQHTLDGNRRMAGEVVEVLVEGPSRNSHREMTGRSRCNRVVNFPGKSELAGKLVSVRIEEGLKHSLRGTLISDISE
ncbi:MAG: tRNA (N6-isopentenyl adenosine(37)-C2)-methylthiotransferase MiaB [Deltaproteobacteria bacterium]|nr:tRNA (N6-isopentenyl adenosine(37)-C2)-methylthiotransferase MiaB [Deltaproteobacteria bacterium]